jgi:hypothetical protein
MSTFGIYKTDHPLLKGFVVSFRRHHQGMNKGPGAWMAAVVRPVVWTTIVGSSDVNKDDAAKRSSDLVRILLEDVAEDQMWIALESGDLPS